MSSLTKRHKSGSSRDSEPLLRYTRENVEAGDEELRRDDDAGNERVRLGFALLMIPSLMFMFYSNNKFTSKSNSNIDFSALAAHGFPGMGGSRGGGGVPDEIRAMYDDKFRDQYERQKQDRYYDRDRYYRDRYERDRYDRDRYERDRYDRYRYSRNRYRSRRRLSDARYDDDPPQEDYGGDESQSNPSGEVPAIEGSQEDKDSENTNKDVANSENKGETGLRLHKNDDRRMEVDLDDNRDDEINDDHEDDRRLAYSDDDHALDDLDYPYHPDRYGMERYGGRYGGGYGGGYGGVGFPGFTGLDHYHSSRDWDHDPHLDIDDDYPLWARRRRKRKEEKKKEVENPFKVILYWSSESLKKTDLPVGTKVFEEAKCLIKECVVTSDKNYLPIADALIFTDEDDLSNIPTKTRADQRWIFHGLRPPVNKTNDNLSKLQNLLNLKWTYTPDSDIVYSIAKVELLFNLSQAQQKYTAIEMQSINVFNVWRRKKRMAVFVDDKCETNSKRETFVEELKKNIDLDIYGECALKPCPNNECFKKFEEEYLFILILEDNLCPDYVSGTIYAALEHNLVPVVLGNVDYSRITPMNSVINVRNFTSHKDLADYLNSIGTDYNLYKTFLEWKKEFRICRVRDDLCQLCTLLHQKPDERLKPKLVSDINEWWSSKAKCEEWTSIVDYS